ncbi:PREDICTED: spheniscin-1-like [Calidris pugnax]|uniref:spheniscin-1-like n=1 Tax=Calidris pugnax TaxID=198806 RepID=UPI00071CB908|nr:PREDICTED: spheniscin-1-like [Calidris pugnax]
MKILYLLFSIFFLLIQGSAASPMDAKSTIGCRLRRGYCTFGQCRYPARHIGRCSGFQKCCKNVWG